MKIQTIHTSIGNEYARCKHSICPWMFADAPYFSWMGTLNGFQLMLDSEFVCQAFSALVVLKLNFRRVNIKWHNEKQTKAKKKHADRFNY